MLLKTWILKTIRTLFVRPIILPIIVQANLRSLNQFYKKVQQIKTIVSNISHPKAIENWSEFYWNVFN